jgi:hypothetical protein
MIRRRDMIKVTALSAATLVLGVPLKAWAGRAPEDRPLPPGQLFEPSTALEFIWNSLCDDQLKSELKTAFSNKMRELFPNFLGVESETVAPSNGGTAHAVVMVSIAKSSVDGHLDVLAHIPDGNGHRTLIHSGRAPHYRHPIMQSHIEQIARKAHDWLRRHSR